MAATLGNVAMCHIKMPSYETALSLFERVRDLQAAHEGAEARGLLATTLNNMGLCHEKMGAIEAAVDLFEVCRAEREEVLGSDSALYAQALDNLAMCKQKQGKLGEAAELLKRSVAIETAALGEDHPTVVMTIFNLGLCQLKAGSAADAVGRFQRARELMLANGGAGSDEYSRVMMGLSQALQEQGDLDRSLMVLQASLETAPAGSISRADTLAGLAKLLQLTSSPSAALPVWKEVIEALHEAAGDPGAGRLLPQALEHAAKCSLQLGLGREAAGHYKACHEAIKRLRGSATGESAMVLTKSANLSLRVGDVDAAVASATAAVTDTQTVFGGRHPNYARACAALVSARAAQGTVDDGCVALAFNLLDVCQSALGADHPDSRGAAKLVNDLMARMG